MLYVPHRNRAGLEDLEWWPCHLPHQAHISSIPSERISPLGTRHFPQASSITNKRMTGTLLAYNLHQALTNDRVQESGSNARSHVPDGQLKPCWRTLQLRIRAEAAPGQKAPVKKSICKNSTHHTLRCSVYGVFIETPRSM